MRPIPIFLSAVAVVVLAVTLGGWDHPLLSSSNLVGRITGLLLRRSVTPGLPSALSDCNGHPNDVRVFATSDLATFDGTDPQKPLLLVVLGEVFDVSDGSRFYARADANAKFGVDSIGYNIFVGRDSSAAFSTGDFVHPQEDVRGLAPSQVKSIVEWRDFYRAHKTYAKVGVVQGLYFDCQGKPTDALDAVRALVEQAEMEAKQEADLMNQFPSCDSEFIAVNPYSTVSCTGGDGRYPRKFFWVSAKQASPRTSQKPLQGAVTPDVANNNNNNEQQRCACLNGNDEAVVRLSRTMRFESYDGCEGTVTSCRLPRKQQ